MLNNANHYLESGIPLPNNKNHQKELHDTEKISSICRSNDSVNDRFQTLENNIQKILTVMIKS